MAAVDALCEGLGALLGPDRSLAVVLEEEPDRALLVVANPLGVAAYRGRVAVPDSGELDLDSDPDGFLERRFLLSGFSDDLRQRFAARRARALVLQDEVRRTAIVL